MGPQARIRLCLACALTMNMVACGTDEPTSGAAPGQATLGVLLPLTGPLANLAVVEEDVMLVALDEINEHGGVLSQPLRTAVRDSRTDAEHSAILAVELMEEEGSEIILAGTSSTVTATVLQEARARGVGVITGVSGRRDLSEVAPGLFFRTLPIADVDAEYTWTDWKNQQLYDEGHRKIAYLTAEAPLYTEGLETTMEGFLELCQPDECSLNDQRYPVDFITAGTDMGALVANIMVDPPDVAMLTGFEPDVAVLLRSLDLANYSGALVVNDLFGAVGDHFASLLRDDMVARIRWVDAAALASPVARELQERFADIHIQRSALGRAELCTYDAVFIAALAIEQSGLTDGGDVSAAMRRVANAPGEVVGPFEFERARALIATGADIDYEGLMLGDFSDQGENTAHQDPAFFGWNGDGQVAAWER